MNSARGAAVNVVVTLQYCGRSAYGCFHLLFYMVNECACGLSNPCVPEICYKPVDLYFRMMVSYTYNNCLFAFGKHGMNA